MKKITRISAGMFGLLALCACSTETAGPSGPPPTIVGNVIATADSLNALRATVVVHVRNADSVVVKFRATNSLEYGEEVGPAAIISGDSAVIPVLGLMPDTRYVMYTVAYGTGGTATGVAADVTTGILPRDLPAYTASGSNPSPGYVVFASGPYGIVMDNTGRVVWYHRFPYGAGLAFMAEHNGHYVARPPPANPSTTDPWVEIDPMGGLVRTRECAQGLPSRPHDLIIDSDAGHWLMCDETRAVDLSGIGGGAAQRVTGTTIQHVDKAGKLLFQWSPFDHFEITGADLADQKPGTVNWTHGNALDIDTDGNLLVSFRNLNEVTKIDVLSGAVIWRLGGRKNQFAFENSGTLPFRGQHSVRVAGAGQLVLLDNVGRPGESRAELYTISAASRTAVLASDYGSSPAVVTQIGGSVQALAGGHMLVSFGTAGRVEEYDADGRVVWQIDGNPGYVFRAQRIQSLYSPGVGMAR